MEITTLMLADDAVVVGDKIYVHGGGWNSIRVPALPTKVARMALVIMFRVAYREAMSDHRVNVVLRHEDGGDAVAGIHVAGVLRVGHGPQQGRGDESYVSQALVFEHVELDRPGRYLFDVEVNGERRGQYAFRLLLPPDPSPTQHSERAEG